jgi:hypothetical protein
MQCAGSACVSTQASPHCVRPGAQAQVPAWHTSPTPQGAKHSPQWRGSRARSTHSAPHCSSPDGQATQAASGSEHHGSAPSHSLWSEHSPVSPPPPLPPPLSGKSSSVSSGPHAATTPSGARRAITIRSRAIEMIVARTASEQAPKIACLATTESGDQPGERRRLLDATRLAQLCKLRPPHEQFRQP